jgi:hypothetical protein
MKLTIELEEPYAQDLELRAYRSGQTLKEYLEEAFAPRVLFARRLKLLRRFRLPGSDQLCRVQKTRPFGVFLRYQVVL